MAIVTFAVYQADYLHSCRMHQDFTEFVKYVNMIYDYNADDGVEYPHPEYREGIDTEEGFIQQVIQHARPSSDDFECAVVGIVHNGRLYGKSSPGSIEGF